MNLEKHMVNVEEWKLHKRLSLIIIDKSGLLKTDHEHFIFLKTYFVLIVLILFHHMKYLLIIKYQWFVVFISWSLPLISTR